MNLPDLSQEYPVSKEQVKAYQRDGHIMLRGVASTAEVSAYRPFIVETVEKHRKEMISRGESPSEKAFIQIMNLWKTIDAMRGFTLARRFAKIAADLMGVGGVRLYQDIVFFKEPGGKFTAWHQDNTYSPLDTDNTIAMWMPLVDVSVEMGSLAFATGSHKHGPLSSLAISDQSEEYFRKLIAQRGFPVVRNSMRAGDATFHSGWMLHHASPNGTNKTREAMVVIYFEDGARIAKPDNPHKESDMRYFPGCKPGDLAASEINPVLFSR
jgi:ectoine hydroxylase-related dioxygenase (phytanoyl-CoA dioxygenase family)